MSVSGVADPPREAEEWPEVAINPAVLRQARTQVNLAISEAALRVSRALTDAEEAPVGPETVARWESGGELPNLVQADAISRTYLVSFVDLFGDELPQPPIFDFRSGTEGPSRFSYETLQRLAEFDDLYQLATRALRAAGRSEELSELVRVRFDEALSLNTAAEIAGAALRQQLQLSNDAQLMWRSNSVAASDLSERVQRAGVFVFHLSLPLSECRGASRWDEAHPPAILVNRADAPAAQVFTQLHELAHLIDQSSPLGSAVCDPSRDPGTKNTRERFANRAAAAALVPKDLLNLVLPGKFPSAPFNSWDLPLRRKVQRSFSVSEHVISLRLYHLGLTRRPPKPRAFWRRPVGEPHARGRTEVSKLRERLGSRALSILGDAVATGAMTEAEVARALRTKPKHIANLLGTGAP